MAGRVDRLCKNAVFLSKFFSNGWGNPDNLRRIFKFRKIVSKREPCMALVSPDHPIEILKKTDFSDHAVLEGRFVSPAANYLPDILPKEIQMAHFQMIVPKRFGPVKPLCIHLAGTGDHGFWRRKVLTAKPLLQEAGISSILLENPFYGMRKPKGQLRSNLRNVSDLFVMGMCLVLESIALFHWAEREGFGPLGITGISMGGHMASLAASIWHKPLSLTPCLSWSTASHVFTQGVMGSAINWPVLKKQYLSNEVYRDELFNMLESPEGHYRIFDLVEQEVTRNLAARLSGVGNVKKCAITKPSDVPAIQSKPKRTFSDPLSLIKSIPLPRLRTEKFSLDDSVPVLPRPESLKHAPPVEFKPCLPIKDALTWEAFQFMRGIMDDCTHLGNYPVPIDPSLIIIVAATDDAYVPNNGTIPLTDLWPGAELRRLNNHGHITAFLFHQQFFRNAIKDSFDRNLKKYYGKAESLVEGARNILQ